MNPDLPPELLEAMRRAALDEIARVEKEFAANAKKGLTPVGHCAHCARRGGCVETVWIDEVTVGR